MDEIQIKITHAIKRTDLSLAVIIQFNGIFLEFSHKIISGHEPKVLVT